VKTLKIKEIRDKIKENVGKVIIGKDEIIDILITTVIAGGHALLEDVPGTGKTVMAKTLAKSIGGDFKRVQFTPDLLPSDITGINYYNQKLSEFVLRRGPIFTNILLADEINRATPRTQGSLLEAMEERQVSIDGVTHKLDTPFFVIATQNPVETQGTFPLPEAQLDRFLVKINMGYPTKEDGKKIIQRFMADNPMDTIEEVCTKEDIIQAAKEYQQVYLCEELQDYILSIIDRTLNHSDILLGVSPRGTLALVKAVRVYAAMDGRDYVTPEDIKTLSPYVLAHRIILKDAMRYKGVDSKVLILDILNEISVPTENWENIKER